MKLNNWRFSGAVVLAFIVGCADHPGTNPDSTEDPKVEPGPGTTTLGLLRQASDCQDLSRAMAAEIKRSIELANTPPVIGVGGGPSTSNPGFGGSAGTSWGSTGGSAPSEPVGAGAQGSSDGGPVFTGTNTQIPGVDEPDFVKTDGEHFFILDGTNLHVAKGFPAGDMEVVTSQPIEGFGDRIFLADGAVEGQRRIVVYSQVDAWAVLAEAGVEDSGTSGSFTKLTVYSFDGALSVLAEYYFEGSLQSARRQQNDVRSVLSVYRQPPVVRTWATDADYQKAELLVLERIQDTGKSVSDYSSDEIAKMISDAVSEILVEESNAALEELDAKDHIPRAFQRSGERLVDVSLDCDDFYVASLGTLAQGVTFVSQVDLDALEQKPASAALLGSAQTTYENQSVTVVASSPQYLPGGETETQLHVFDVGDEPLAYRASGVVPGVIKGQFSLDEHEGVLRVVTSEPGSNNLYNLKSTETDLEVVGETGPFGLNEDVYAVRFVGDTGYVVTFRQIDPLFVFDLADPENPTMLGELEMPGFSEYMHPVGDSHLLTIGQSEGWNTVLRLFDVSDRTSPALVFDHAFAYGLSSDASIDHRAFTFFADRELLAVPFSGWNYDSNVPINEIALVRVSTSAGFSDLGALDGTALSSAILSTTDTCDPWSVADQSRLQRGIFIEDTLYGAAMTGLVAAPVSAPETVTGTVAFPMDCGGSWGGTGGTGGWVGEGGAAGEPGTDGFAGESAGGAGGAD